MESNLNLPNPVSNSSRNLSTLAAAMLPQNPFVGLRPFTSDEGLLFFGRRDQTLALLEQLHKTRFLAVVGSSGCGKSSLIRAGLIPKLKAGFLVEHSDQWHIAITKPGDAPIENLAQSLVETFGQETDLNAQAALVAGMRGSCAQALVEYLRPLLKDSSTNLLLLIDQFEELFNFAGYKEKQALGASDEQNKEKHLADTIEHERRHDEASDFVSIMLALAKQNDVPVYVVMTMRSDFLGDCDAFYGLPEAMNRSQYLVPRLTRQQRLEAIESPIVLSGQKITPRALDSVLNDAGEEGDQLPVMQHAMMRTWEKWRASGDASIDLSDYELAGTTKRALSDDAEEALAGLSQDDLQIAERLFQSLTDTDARGRQIRRPAHLSEIQAITEADRGKLMEIIDRFRNDGRSFLNLSQDKKDPLVDISHESLIRQWERLRDWVAKEALWKELYLRLVGNAVRFNKGDDVLLSGPALQAALAWVEGRKPNEAWASRYQPDLGVVLKFLDDSKLQRDKDAVERERIRNEEAAREKRDLEQAQLIAEQKQRVAEAEAAARRVELQQALILAEQKEKAARWQRRAIYALTASLIVAVAGVVLSVMFGVSARANARSARSSEEKAVANAIAARKSAQETSDAKIELDKSYRALTESFNKSENLKTQLSKSLEKERILTAEARAATVRFQIQARKALAAAQSEKTARQNESKANQARIEALARSEEAEKNATFERSKAIAMQTANNTFREALFLSRTNDPQAAAEKFKEAAEEYKAISDDDAEATAYFEVGDTFINSGLSSKNSKMLQPGVDYLEKANTAYKAINNLYGQAAVSLRMGDLLTSDAVQEEASVEDVNQAREFAMELYKDAYKNYKESKNPSGMKYAARKLVSSYVKAGKFYADQQDPENAKYHFDAAVAVYAEAKDPQLEALTYVDIGFALGGPEIDKYTKQALESAIKNGGKNSVMEAETSWYIGKKFRENMFATDASSVEYHKLFQLASNSFESALNTYQGLNDRIKQAELHDDLGMLQQAAGVSGALEHLNKALALYSGEKEESERGRILLDIGAVHEASGNIEEARKTYEAARDIFEKTEAGWEEIRAKRALERLSEPQGRPRKRR